MIATNFTRDDCKLSRRHVSYEALQREYCCAECEGRLVMKPPSERIEEWHIECGRCGSVNFIHQHEVARQKVDAIEVIAGLPADLAVLVNQKQRGKNNAIER
jgi:DNA-directed RNA polymerase subunit RPC12/RpoP